MTFSLICCYNFTMFSWLKKYFIPHGKNDYKPHFLRHRSAILVLFLVLIVELSFLVQVFVVFDKTSFLASVLPGVLTTLTNKERARSDAPPLIENNLLNQAAQLKANDMALHGYFAHTSPQGKTPWYWFDQVGYKYALAGENLAVNFFESRDVAEAWMDSPTHRANIMKKDYTEIGIGVATGTYEGRHTVFVAQLFGTPLAIPTTPAASAPAVPTQPAIKTTPEATTPATPKTPPVAPRAPTQTTPAVTPRTVATSPTEMQVLGEETTAIESASLFSQMKSFIEKVLASPREYVTYVYGGILLIVILALALAVFIKREFQHPDIIGRGAAIVAIIILLIFVNREVLRTDTKVEPDDLGASAISSLR